MTTGPGGRGRQPEDPALRAVAAGSAGLGLAAIVAHVAGVLPMRFFLEFIGAPSLVALAALAFWAARAGGDVFLHNLRLGVAAGAVATVAYDVVRFAAQGLRVFHYNAFYAIHVFGGWITSRPPASAPATVAGWIYHTWNGLSFAVMFTLTFGRARHWWYGLVYGLVMEAMMLGLYPQFLSIKDRTGFVVISMLGHGVYGSVLGLMASRWGRTWVRQASPRRPAARVAAR